MIVDLEIWRSEKSKLWLRWFYLCGFFGQLNRESKQLTEIF